MSDFQSMARIYRSSDLIPSAFPIPENHTLVSMGRKRERTPFGERLFAARTHAKLTQPDLAQRVGMSQSTLAEAEYTAQGSSFTAQIANACGVRSEWLATGDGAMLAGRFELPLFLRHDASEPAVSYGLAPILAWEHPDDLPAGDFVMVPRLNVSLSAGAGRTQVAIEFAKNAPQAFRADWVREQRLKPRSLAAMTAVGDSMEPSIHHGDSLLVDTSQTDVVDGKVYALWYDGGERVKRLFRLPGGGLRIKSDNPQYGPIELGPEYPGHVRIIGRVVHRSGPGGL